MKDYRDTLDMQAEETIHELARTRDKRKRKTLQQYLDYLTEALVKVETDLGTRA